MQTAKTDRCKYKGRLLRDQVITAEVSDDTKADTNLSIAPSIADHTNIVSIEQASTM